MKIAANIPALVAQAGERHVPADGEFVGLFFSDV
jgi:hypothetical protein